VDEPVEAPLRVERVEELAHRARRVPEQEQPRAAGAVALDGLEGLLPDAARLVGDVEELVA
jgi:hypothetical protein